MKKKKLDLFGFDIDGNNLYFNARDVNGIFCLDMFTGKVRYMAMSAKDNVGDCQLYQDAKVDGGKVWFSPYAAENILMYDKELNVCEYIDVPKLTGHGRSSVKFYGWHDCGEWLILVPVEYPAILKINKKTQKVKIVKWEEKLLKEYPDFLKINAWLAIAWDFEVVDGKMYLLAENVIIKYDMETDEVSFAQMNHEGRMYTGIVQYRDGFALIDRMYSELVVWQEGGRVEKLDINLGYRGTNAGDDGCPLGLFKVGKGIAVVQGKADFLLYVDELGQAHKINLCIKREEGQELLFSRVKQKENMLIFPLDGQNKVLLANTDDWSQRCIEMDLEKIDFTPIRAKMELEGSIMENSVCYGLAEFIERIKKCDGRERTENKTHNVGRHIFQNI